MENIENGDFVILITDQKQFVCEGVLSNYLPDGEPYCAVDGIGYDLATEGGTIDVILKIKKP